MTMYKVKQGDCLSSIAQARGFGHYGAIYNHEKNAFFRKKRPNPSIIYPGDELFIPPLKTKVVERAAGQRHLFRLCMPSTLIRIVVRDRGGGTIPDSDYTLVVDGQELAGKTMDGLVAQAIPAEAQEARLDIPSLRLRMHLRLGHLDPSDTVSGAQSRLNNLRYHAGTVDGILGIRTRTAIRAFQRSEGLDDTGALDEATRATLEKRHGS